MRGPNDPFSQSPAGCVISPPSSCTPVRTSHRALQGLRVRNYYPVDLLTQFSYYCTGKHLSDHLVTPLLMLQRAQVLEVQPEVVVATPGRLLSLCGETPASTKARQNRHLTMEDALARAQLDQEDSSLPPVLSLR